MSREVGSPGQEREVYRVLIADDDRQCRSSISLLLKHDGFEPVEVDGGQLLLKVLRRQLFGDFDSEGVRLTAREYRTCAADSRTADSRTPEASFSPIHFVVLDYNMPDLTGLEVLRQIEREWARRASANRRVAARRRRFPPALMVSGEASPSLEREVKALGGFGVLPKPIRPDAFRSAIKNLVGLLR